MRACVGPFFPPRAEYERVPCTRARRASAYCPRHLQHVSRVRARSQGRAASAKVVATARAASTPSRRPLPRRVFRRLGGKTRVIRPKEVDSFPALQEPRWSDSPFQTHHRRYIQLSRRRRETPPRFRFAHERIDPFLLFDDVATTARRPTSPSRPSTRIAALRPSVLSRARRARDSMAITAHLARRCAWMTAGSAFGTRTCHR